MEKQVQTKEEYKARQAKEEQLYKDSKLKKNPNHRVTPNLTPRGRDILMRLQNKSIDTDGERSYTLNEDIVNSRRMNKHELAEAHRRNNAKIEELKKTLNETSNKPSKPKENES